MGRGGMQEETTEKQLTPRYHYFLGTPYASPFLASTLRHVEIVALLRESSNKFQVCTGEPLPQDLPHLLQVQASLEQNKFIHLVKEGFPVLLCNIRVFTNNINPSIDCSLIRATSFLLEQPHSTTFEIYVFTLPVPIFTARLRIFWNCHM